MKHLLLLGGPPGVGKTRVLEHLKRSEPSAAVLDADDVWRESSSLDTTENRRFAVNNVVTVAKGYFDADCELVVVAWVFARSELFDPVREGLIGVADKVSQIYLIADDATLAERLRLRGDFGKLDYAKTRLDLINKLPFPTIDTSRKTPEAVTLEIRSLL